MGRKQLGKEAAGLCPEQLCFTLTPQTGIRGCLELRDEGVGSVTAIGDKIGRIKPKGLGRLRRAVKEWSWRGMSRGGVNSSEGHQCWYRLLRNPRELKDVHEGYEAFFISLPSPSPCRDNETETINIMSARGWSASPSKNK